MGQAENKEARSHDRRKPVDNIPPYDGILPFNAMREKCRELGNKIQFGHTGGHTNLLSRDLAAISQTG